MDSLADICNFAIANGMQLGFPEFVNAVEMPHLLCWIEQFGARPAVIKMNAEVDLEKLGSRD